MRFSKFSCFLAAGKTRCTTKFGISYQTQPIPIVMTEYWTTCLVWFKTMVVRKTIVYVDPCVSMFQTMVGRMDVSIYRQMLLMICSLLLMHMFKFMSIERNKFDEHISIHMGHMFSPSQLALPPSFEKAMVRVVRHSES